MFIHQLTESLKPINFILVFFISVIGFSQSKTDSNLIKASVILDAIYKNYAAPNTNLLRENYPYDEKYTPDYLAANPGSIKPNEYAYLWPYSGTLSATVVLYEATKDKAYKKLLDEKIIPGLEKYFDVKRKPFAYASYINTAKPSDRFYDDNIWLGIDFTELYAISKQKKYLDKHNSFGNLYGVDMMKNWVVAFTGVSKKSSRKIPAPMRPLLCLRLNFSG